jgi:hypothetical protein
MFSSDVLNRSSAGPRRQRTDRRNADRRTRGRLRELCDEVLASYRLAQGDQLLTTEERDSARHILRRVTPRLAP